MLTQDELKRLFHYDPDTGLFTRLVSSGPVKAGSIAGYLHPTGHIHIQVHNKIYGAHRLAWLYTYGNFVNEIDHINRIASDNRISNLRSVNRKQNSENRTAPKNNTSGFKGVYFHKGAGKWYARIKHNKVDIHLGTFLTPEMASVAYQQAASRLHTHNPDAMESLA